MTEVSRARPHADVLASVRTGQDLGCFELLDLLFSRSPEERPLHPASSVREDGPRHAGKANAAVRRSECALFQFHGCAPGRC